MVWLSFKKDDLGGWWQLYFVEAHSLYTEVSVCSRLDSVPTTTRQLWSSTQYPSNTIETLIGPESLWSFVIDRWTCWYISFFGYVQYPVRCRGVLLHRVRDRSKVNILLLHGHCGFAYKSWMLLVTLLRVSFQLPLLRTMIIHLGQTVYSAQMTRCCDQARWSRYFWDFYVYTGYAMILRRLYAMHICAMIASASALRGGCACNYGYLPLPEG